MIAAVHLHLAHSCSVLHLLGKQGTHLSHAGPYPIVAEACLFLHGPGSVPGKEISSDLSSRSSHSREVQRWRSTIVDPTRREGAIRRPSAWTRYGLSSWGFSSAGRARTGDMKRPFRS